tara:strand:- start:199 stop:852 length:654 start_codon:yes stop_codon:yes gene_type:complete
MPRIIKERKKLVTPENSASFLPIFISTVIGILIIFFFVIPEFIKSNKVNLELNELVRKKNELKNLKLKYEKINQKFYKLNNEKSRIIELISGTSNLDTFLANLGTIGRKNNIQFLSIIPKSVKIYEDNNSLNNKNNNFNPITEIDPLLVEGIKKYLFDLTFKTNFANLQAFLRELEFQENVILIKDIDVNLIDNNNLTKIDNNNLDVNLSMTIYGKI